MLYTALSMINDLYSPAAADSPTDITAVLVTVTSITVSWTPPATVSGYKVYWSGDGGADTGNMSVGADDRTATITGLTTGLTYEITLVGLSDYLPGPPVAVTITLGESNIVVCQMFSCYGISEFIPPFNSCGL